MIDGVPPRPQRPPFRNVFAVLAGFVTVVVVSMGADEIMYATGVFPPRTQPMRDDGLFALALAYRAAAGVAGGWVAARLASSHPMRQALIVGLIGLALSAIGAIAMAGKDVGPAWYSWALAATAAPCAWAGGRLARPSRA